MLKVTPPNDLTSGVQRFEPCHDCICLWWLEFGQRSPAPREVGPETWLWELTQSPVEELTADESNQETLPPHEGSNGA